MARIPKGTLVHNQWNWRPDRIVGGQSFLGAVAGKYTLTGLYNNTSGQDYLYVIGLSVGTTPGPTMGGNFYIISGTGGMTPAGVQAQNVYPLKGALPGVATGGYNTFLGANALGGYMNQGNSDWRWIYNWPMAILPPGYSFVCQSGEVNVPLGMGIWWYVGVAL